MYGTVMDHLYCIVSSIPNLMYVDTVVCVHLYIPISLIATRQRIP
jgi:hypothetical protein